MIVDKILVPSRTSGYFLYIKLVDFLILTKSWIFSLIKKEE